MHDWIPIKMEFRKQEVLLNSTFLVRPHEFSNTNVSEFWNYRRLFHIFCVASCIFAQGLESGLGFHEPPFGSFTFLHLIEWNWVCLLMVVWSLLEVNEQKLPTHFANKKSKSNFSNFFYLKSFSFDIFFRDPCVLVCRLYIILCIVCLFLLISDPNP